MHVEVVNSWPIEPNKIKLGARIQLLTVFGKVTFRVRKITKDSVELESDSLVTFLDKKNGKWDYDGCVIDKHATCTITIV